MSSARRLTTSGKPAKAWTLGSQGCLATASASALSLRVLFLSSHCFSCMISRGYVEATRESSWSIGIFAAWVAPWVAPCGAAWEDVFCWVDDDAYTRVSAETRLAAHTIATRARKLTGNSSEFMRLLSGRSVLRPSKLVTVTEYRPNRIAEAPPCSAQVFSPAL